MIVYSVSWKGDHLGVFDPKAVQSEAQRMAEALMDREFEADALDIEQALYKMAYRHEGGRKVLIRQNSESFGDDTTDYVFHVESMMVSRGLPVEERVQDAREARGLVKGWLKELGLEDVKFRCRWVDFTDLARGGCVFVDLINWWDCPQDERDSRIRARDIIMGRLNAHGAILSSDY